MGNHADTVIVGLGDTGFACARYLAASGRGIAVTDSRTCPPRLADMRRALPQVHLALGGFDRELLLAAREIVVSPGVSRTDPTLAAAAARGIPVVGEIELFARVANAPVVAITGSNGKSTVTSLVGEMVRAAGGDAAVGGNLGTPALELLRRPPPMFYVLELSSFQLETVQSLDARVATVLNVSPDHMDRYDDLNAYSEAKRRVFRGAGTMVLNADDPQVRAMAEPDRAAVWFGLASARADTDYGCVRHRDALWLARGERPLMPADELPLAGMHNVANALAALALGEAMGLAETEMLAALRCFRGLPHRMERVAERDGVVFLNDSKGTNVGATVAALTGMSQPVVLIAGGLGKGADFTPLAQAARGRLRAAVLIGHDGPALAAVLEPVCPVFHAPDMGTAVRRASDRARPGDAVLLSPACASLDQFASYAARGEAFRRAVQAVAAGVEDR